MAMVAAKAWTAAETAAECWRPRVPGVTLGGSTIGLRERDWGGMERLTPSVEKASVGYTPAVELAACPRPWELGGSPSNLDADR